MASGINRAPLGLQSLLGTKALGQNPDALSELVRPIVDLAPFWWAQQRWQVSQTVDPGTFAVGEITSLRITVPQNEVWLVPYAHMRAIYGVATTKSGFHISTLIDSTLGAAGECALAEWYFNNTCDNALDTQYCVYQPPYPMFWPAGTVFTGFNDRALGIGAIWNLSVTRLPLRI